jgi:hypothetical protein
MLFGTQVTSHYTLASMSVPCLDQDFMSKKVKNASLTLEVRVEWCLCGHLVKVKQLDDFLIGSA